MASTRDYFRTTFAKPYYYWVFAAVIIPGLAFLPIYTFNLPYAKSLGMSDDAYFKLTAVFFCISLAQAYPLGWLADKFHPLRVAMVTLALHAVVALAAGLLIHDRTTFSVAMIVTGTLQGSWGTATASLTALLFPRQKFAQFASALGILVSFLMVLAGIGVGPALDWAGRPYHCTYLAAFVLDIVGLVATFVLFRKFLALGGAKHYVAPE